MINSKIAVGIDIGGTNTDLGIVNEEGKVLAKTSFSTQVSDNFEEYIKVLSDNIKSLLKANDLEGKILGVGVGAPNANFYKGTIEHAPNLLWKGVLHFSKMLSQEVGYKVVLTNDANAAAIGEKVYGGGKYMQHFALVTLGTGLGSGIVIDGKLLYGSDGFAGELGHTIVVKEDGRQCGCGRKGCLETIASASGIVTTIKQLLESEKTASVFRNVSVDEIKSIDIFEAANKGDELALKAFDITADYLGFSLTNLIAITSPEAIFLSGGLAHAGDLLFKPLQQYYDKYVLPLFKGKTVILPSQLPDGNTGLMGAAALALSELS
ncbi:MAG: ROK family protein [Bacteroidales bacterium]|jgi:glucokinase|nr:ROK family protein [Bacteroidales bacterium]